MLSEQVAHLKTTIKSENQLMLQGSNLQSLSVRSKTVNSIISSTMIKCLERKTVMCLDRSNSKSLKETSLSPFMTFLMSPSDTPTLENLLKKSFQSETFINRTVRCSTSISTMTGIRHKSRSLKSKQHPVSSTLTSFGTTNLRLVKSW